MKVLGTETTPEGKYYFGCIPAMIVAFVFIFVFSLLAILTMWSLGMVIQTWLWFITLL